jgi:hypothetical protein
LKKELLGRVWGTRGNFDVISENLAPGLENIRLSNDDEKVKKAIEHKNKLIDFDRTSAKRTQVIDDESDYFSTNSKWLSQKQKVLLDVRN